MEKVVIWGTGEIAEKTFTRCAYISNYEIVGIVDNNERKWGNKFRNYVISSPDILKEEIADIIVVLTDKYAEIYSQIVKDYPSYSNRTANKFYFYKQAILDKYSDSNNKEIIEIINYLRNHELREFNYPFAEKYDEKKIAVVKDEECGLYYVLHNSKKLYLSRKFDTEQKAKDYYKSLLIEQDEESPHRYCDDDFKPGKNDVIIDAGAAEGIFALDYIDLAREIYLIDADELWIEALKYTFKDYGEKVHIIHSFLGAFNEIGITDTLDALIDRPVNFVKMDIEGAEWDALRGAEQLINKAKSLRLAICAYHSDFDQELIETFMDKHTIKHKTTKGYMWFPYSCRETYISTELHRGIIRGEK